MKLFIPKSATIVNNRAGYMQYNYNLPISFEIWKRDVLLFSHYDQGFTQSKGDHQRYLAGTGQTLESPFANNHPMGDIPAKPFNQFGSGYYGVADIEPGIYTIKVTNLGTNPYYPVIAFKQTQLNETTVLAKIEAGETKEFNFIANQENIWYKFNLWGAWLDSAGKITVDFTTASPAIDQTKLDLANLIADSSPSPAPSPTPTPSPAPAPLPTQTPSPTPNPAPAPSPSPAPATSPAGSITFEQASNMVIEFLKKNWPVVLIVVVFF